MLTPLGGFFCQTVAALAWLIDEEPTMEPPLIDTGVDSLLADCKTAYDLGFVPALYEALCTVRQFDLSVPSWALDAVTKILGEVILTRKRSGRLKNLLQELEYYDRWLTVVNAQVTGDLSLEKSYEKASELLAHEGAAIGVEAIKKSYLQIQKRMEESGNKRNIYFILDRVQNRLADLENT